MDYQNCECPKCGNSNTLKGVQYNQANIFPEGRTIFNMGSEILHVFCANCGYIKESYVKSPEKFNK